MAFTREQWARDFLAALGNPSPSQATVDWVVGWTVHETSTGGGAQFNLLNTTEQASGSTFFNYLNPQHTFGVQNYPSYSEGINENARVLGENFGGYAALKDALVQNNTVALNGPSSGVRQGLTTWCGGCGYGVGFQQIGAAHRNDSFSYGSASGGGGGVGSYLALGSGSGGGGGGSSGGGNIFSQLCANMPPSMSFLLCGIQPADKAAVDTISGAAEGAIQGANPTTNILTTVTNLFGKLLIFTLGLFLLYVGFRLLFGHPEAAISEKLIDKLTESGEGESAGEEESAAPAESSSEGSAEGTSKPATPKASPVGQGTQQQTRSVKVNGKEVTPTGQKAEPKKEGKVEKAEKLAKVAAVAA